MDSDDIIGYTVVSIILLLVVGGIVIAIYDSIAYQPHRAEDAKNQCMMRGFDNYYSYKGLFRKRAYGVKCHYEDYTRKSVDIDDGTAITIA